ncbi:MAG: hypothetical protein SGPRY_000613 [Prymnesium sp.]
MASDGEIEISHPSSRGEHTSPRLPQLTSGRASPSPLPSHVCTRPPADAEGSFTLDEVMHATRAMAADLAAAQQSKMALQAALQQRTAHLNSARLAQEALVSAGSAAALLAEELAAVEAALQSASRHLHHAQRAEVLSSPHHNAYWESVQQQTEPIQVLTADAANAAALFYQRISVAEQQMTRMEAAQSAAAFAHAEQCRAQSEADRAAAAAVAAADATFSLGGARETCSVTSDGCLSAYRK